MKHKHILKYFFTLTLIIFSYQSIWSQDNITDEEKRFDLNQNGELSPERKGIDG